MSKFAAKSAFLFAIFLFIFSLATRNVSAATVVTSSNMNGWAFQINSSDGVGAFVEGPLSPPNVSVGSVRLFTGTNGNQSSALHKKFQGTKISDITNFDYSSFSNVSNAGTPSQPMVVINVTVGSISDVISFDPGDQTNQYSQLNLWQTWNAEEGFWRSQNVSSFPGGTLQQYVTYVQDLYTASDVTITDRLDDTGGLRFQVGPAGLGDVFDGYVDNFVIGINNVDTTYDFEPSVVTPSNNYTQQFYSDNNWQNPVGGTTVANNTNTLGFNWGSGSPAGVPADNFSAEWTGTFNFENALYRFTAATDKQLEVYVDGNRIVNQTAYGTTQAIYQGTAGVKTVTVKYSHGTGNAFVRYNFWKTSDCYDMNADNNINSMDLQIVAKKFTTDGSLSPYNVNGDSQVNATDLMKLSQKFGKTCGVNFL